MSEMEQKPLNPEIPDKIQRINGKFAPGVSGNPAGKPLGTKSFSTLWDESIKDIAKLNNISKNEAEKVLIKTAWKQAKDGQFQFYKDIHDRLYGSATQPLDLTSGGKPIVFMPYEIIDKYGLNELPPSPITNSEGQAPL